MASLETGGFARSTVPIDPGLVDPRLLSLDYSKLLEGANQGLQLANNFGQLRDQAIARDQALRTRDAAIQAANIKARLAAQQSNADLELLPQETAARRSGLQLKNLQVAGDIARNPSAQELENLQLDTGLGKQRFELATQPKKQALELGSMDVEAGAQRLAQQKQQLDSLTNQTQQLVAEETNAFLKQHPEATQQDLQAKLMTSRRLLDHMQKLDKFEKDNPDFVTSGAAAEFARNKAAVATGDATVSSGGIPPSATVVNPNREFSVRTARNLADADKVLNFGSLSAIQAFQATPEGKRIVGKILSTPAAFGYDLQKENKGQDLKAVEEFRKALQNGIPPTPQTTPTPPASANPAATSTQKKTPITLTPAPTPSAALPAPVAQNPTPVASLPIATIPAPVVPAPAIVPKTQPKPVAARKYPTLTPQEAAMQPPGTLFYDTEGNLRKRH